MRLVEGIYIDVLVLVGLPWIFMLLDNMVEHIFVVIGVIIGFNYNVVFIVNFVVGLDKKRSLKSW